MRLVHVNEFRRWGSTGGSSLMGAKRLPRGRRIETLAPPATYVGCGPVRQLVRLDQEQRVGACEPKRPSYLAEGMNGFSQRPWTLHQPQLRVSWSRRVGNPPREHYQGKGEGGASGHQILRCMVAGRGVRSMLMRVLCSSRKKASSR